MLTLRLEGSAALREEGRRMMMTPSVPQILLVVKLVLVLILRLVLKAWRYRLPR
jgi:hypothetical protein